MYEDGRADTEAVVFPALIPLLSREKHFDYNKLYARPAL
jgi:hypothetical protein